MVPLFCRGAILLACCYIPYSVALSLVSYTAPRRLFLGTAATAIIAASEVPSRRQPSAATEFLIPAAQIKLRIDKSIAVASSSQKSEKERVESLRHIWLQGKPLADPRASANLASEQTATLAPAQEYLDTYSRNRKSLLIWQQPGALLVQNGEVSAWKRLRRQERSKEAADPLRAAFNVYTDNLNFSAKEYVLTVDKDKKSQLIRNNQLPTVSTVVNADLDLRYLYRNQILTALADTQAELALQDNDDSSCLEEVQRLLESAQKATDSWFSFIDSVEVEEATRRARELE